MRALLRPAFSNVLPMGTTHGVNATGNTFTFNGYNWRVDGGGTDLGGTYSNVWDIVSQTSGTHFDQGVNDWLTNLDGYVKLTLPAPTVLTGCQFTIPQFSSGSWSASFAFEGLDRSSDPNGVWRVLGSPVTFAVTGSEEITITAAFTATFPIEEFRIRNSGAGSPLARGFRFGKILSLY